jgi:hypothetical protein
MRCSSTVNLGSDRKLSQSWLYLDEDDGGSRSSTAFSSQAKAGSGLDIVNVRRRSSLCGSGSMLQILCHPDGFNCFGAITPLRACPLRACQVDIGQLPGSTLEGLHARSTRRKACSTASALRW